MKVLVIGDPLLTAAQMKEAVHSVLGEMVQVFMVDWQPASEEEFWHLRSLVEKQGPEAGQPPQEIFDHVGEVDLILTQHTPLNHAIIQAAKQCKVIGVCRAGLENVDVTTASAQNIAVSRTMGRNAHAVSDYTIGLMLAEMRNIARAHAALKEGRWQKKYANAAFVGDMYGKTVGLIGFGYIGHLVARKLSGFTVHLLVYDPYAQQEDVQKVGGKLVSLEELCQASDFISMHARLSKETQGLLGAHEFSLMKPTVYLINTARAGLIEEQALLRALQTKRIGGAAIDVYPTEPPPPNHPLLQMDNVTITPHLAGSTQDVFRRTPYLLLEELQRVAKEGHPRWFINADKVTLDYAKLFAHGGR